MPTIICQTDLHFYSGSSDKVYHVCVVAEDDGTYSTAFAYGRRHSTLNQGYKIRNTIEFKAQSSLNKVVSEKRGKGYEISPGVSGSYPFSFLKASTAAAPAEYTPNEPVEERERTGIEVQLLNAISEVEMARCLANPAMGAQEKRNGERRAACLRDGEYFSSNRKGFKTSLPVPVADALSKTRYTSMAVDGELIGDIFYAFDLLECDGKDYKGASFFSRFKTLTTLFSSVVGKHFSIIPLALSCFDKTVLLERLRKEGREGIVFKELTAPVTPGKPTSGGSQLKFKFVEDCQVIVSSHNAKRSVSIYVLDKGKRVDVGNVTIPPNHEIPAVGSVVGCQYLYYFDNGGSLYQPVYQGLRSDLDASDCTLTQLKRAPLDMAA